MNPDKVIPIIQKIKTLKTCDECIEFNKELGNWTSMLDPKEVVKIREEILSQSIRIKMGMI